MSDKLNDKDLDNLFRDSLESAEAQPSENFWSRAEENILDNSIKTSVESAEVEPSASFWNKAYESILDREALSYLNRIAMWRGAAIVLGLAVAGLIGYNVYITSKVNSLGKQVADIQSGIAAQNNSNSALAMNTKPTNTSAPQGNNTQSLPVAASENNNSTEATPTTVENKKLKDKTKQTHNNVVAANIANNTSNNKPVFALNNNRLNATRTTTSVTVAYSSSKKDKHSPKVFGTHTPEQLYERNYITMLGEESAQPQLLPTPEKTIIQRPSSKLADLIYANSSTLSQPDSVDRASVGNNAPIGKKVSNSKISVSGFIAPGISLGSFEPAEKQQFAYSSGVKFAYDLSSKWTLQLGCNYQATQFYIKNTIVNATPLEYGYVYQVATSSGNVYAGQLSQTGNLANAYGSGSRTYLDIPLQIKYNFHNNSRYYKIYATAGGSMNMLMNNNVSLNVENPWGKENITVNNVAGANKLSYSYLVGMGVAYKLGSGVSIYAEPSWVGSITSISNTVAVKPYTGFLSLAGGVTYHF